MTANIPPRQVCPLCGTDDDVTAMPVGTSNTWAYRCAAEGYAWNVEVSTRPEGRSGITEELGLYHDLPALLNADEPWLEHGIIEHRYKLAHPDVYFDELLPRYGHVAQGPKRYTVSAFMARALGQLASEGILDWQYADATGFWSYNRHISYWALRPGPPKPERLTWSEFARSQQHDPDDWSLAR